MTREQFAESLLRTERCKIVQGIFLYRAPLHARVDSRLVTFEAANLHEAIKTYFRIAPRGAATITQFEVMVRAWRNVVSVPPNKGGCEITARELSAIKKQNEAIRVYAEVGKLVPRDVARKVGLSIDDPRVDQTDRPAPAAGRPKREETRLMEAAQRFVTSPREPGMLAPALPDRPDEAEDI